MLLTLALAWAVNPYSDDFEDGMMPPWRPDQGLWLEADGSLSGMQDTDGPAVVNPLDHRDLADAIVVTTHVTGEGVGGITYFNGTDGGWCAVWAGHGDVWIGTDSSGAVQVIDGPDPGPDVEVEVVVAIDELETVVVFDGLQAYSGPTSCDAYPPNGDVAISALAGAGTIYFHDWALELGGVDTDGDGADDEDDCAPEDPTISPLAEEVWYDGVDQDCQADDDFDQDHDGVVLDDDCDDTDPFVYPGAEDLWYDGRDSDCGGNDDFDADGDGHQVEGAGGDDCDDGDATTYPGSTTDESDGVDHDCDGFIPAPDTGDTDDTGSGDGDTAADSGDGKDDPGDCGCGTPGRPGAALALGAAALVSAARRRSRR